MSDDNGSAVEVIAPGGWRARLIGSDTKAILIGLLIIVAGAVMFYNFEEDRRTAREERGKFSDQHKITQTLLQTVITNQRAMMEQIREQQSNSRDELGEITYILTLSQDQRDRLKLEMPMTLRKKLNGSQRP